MKEGWKYMKLGEVCDFEGGSQPPKSEWLTQQLDGYVRMLQIRDFTKSRSCEIEYVKMSKKLRLCKSDDILIGRYGASVGKILTGLEGAYNVAIIKSIPNESVISKRYIRRFFESGLFQNHLIKICNARAAQAGFSKEDIYDVQIPVPPLPDQQRIVSYLDAEFAKIEALKANAEKQLQAAKDLFQAALKKLLTPKEGWVEKKLGEIGTFTRGGNFTKSDFVQKGIPCIHYGQIHMHFGVVTENCLTYLPNDFPKLKFAQKGDLIIAITSEDNEGSCKCTAWLGSEDVAVGGHIAVFHHQLYPVFMSYFFMSPSFQNDKLAYTHGFKVVEIKPSDIAKIDISYPQPNEQKRIVARLDALSANVKALQTNYTETITLCNDLKQALLKKVFE